MEGPRFWSADEFDRQAQRLYEAGDYDGALETLRRGAVLFPEAVELLVSIGYTHLAREEFVWARRSFSQALEREPDHEDALVGLGESRLKLGERARGFQCFERVLDLGFGRDLDLMLSIGRALFREGLWEHAERFFRRAVAADEGSSDAAADLAYTFHRQGDGVKARQWLERCLELDEENHDARSLLANLFGLFELSKILTDGMFSSAYMALATVVCVLILDGAVAVAMETEFARKSRRAARFRPPRCARREASPGPRPRR